MNVDVFLTLSDFPNSAVAVEPIKHTVLIGPRKGHGPCDAPACDVAGGVV